MDTYTYKKKFLLKAIWILIISYCALLQPTFAKWIINNDPNSQQNNTDVRNVEASIDRMKAAYGERLKLKVKANYDTDSSLNLDSLKTDFRVLGVQKSKQVRIINGKSDSFTEWTINILPNKTGNLEIPSIALDNLKTESIIILISDKPMPQKNVTKTNEPVFVTTELSNKNIFIQQETILTARIYYRIQLLGEKQVTPLKVDNAIVQKLGDSRSFSTVIDGQPYQVDELKFSIHPQQAGMLSIPSLVFNGAVAVQQDPFGFGGFGSFNSFFDQSGEPFSIASEPLQLTVNEQIPDYPDAPWLPAKNFVATQSWNRSIQGMPVGEPITCTIKIQAEGLTSAQIPNIEVTQMEGISIYTDKPETNDFATNDGVIGEKKITITYIPTQPGKYQTPEIAYTWFDLTNKEIKTTKLDNVVLNALGTAPQPLANDNHSVAASNQSYSANNLDDGNSFAAVSATEANNIWKYAAFILAGLWLLFLFAWLYKKFISPRQKKIFNGIGNIFAKTNQEASTFELLIEACKAQNLVDVIRYLEKWAQYFTKISQPYSASEVIAKLNSDIISQYYAELNLSIYGRKEFTLGFQDLITECKKIRKTAKSKTAKKEQIIDIYPS